MRVRWTRRAIQDLQDIGDYIAQDSPGAARRWVARLRERARLAAPFPYSGRRVPEQSREDVREVLLGNYRIVYQIYPDLIDILTVFEGHRLFPAGALPESSRIDD